jgi:hypothetical protein
MINRRLKQLFFAVLCLEIAPAAAPIAHADVPGYLFRDFDQRSALRADSTAIRPPPAAKDNIAADAGRR